MKYPEAKPSILQGGISMARGSLPRVLMIVFAHLGKNVHILAGDIDMAVLIH